MSEPFDDELFGDNLDARKTHDELVLAQSKLGLFLDLVPAGLFIHQRQGVIFANQEASRILGLPASGLVGSHFLDFVPDTQLATAHGAFSHCFDDRQTIRGLEIILRDQAERLEIIQVSMSPLFWEGLPVINIVFTDISELKEKERTLYRLSTTDDMTGVFNRRFFLERMDEIFLRFRRDQEPFSVLSLDIDHFKRINDTYGHTCGDQAIRTFVRTIMSSLRRIDIPGRTGGEEFCIVLPGLGEAAALAVAETIRQRTAETVSTYEGAAIRFTASIGVVEARPGDESIDAILHRADIALYRAKHNGRNRVEAR